jgi:hypothetical protein
VTLVWLCGAVYHEASRRREEQVEEVLEQLRSLSLEERQRLATEAIKRGSAELRKIDRIEACAALDEIETDLVFGLIENYRHGRSENFRDSGPCRKVLAEFVYESDIIISTQFLVPNAGAMSYSFLTAPKDSKQLLMADAVRVLSLASGKLWLDEISAELNAFRQTLDRATAFSEKDLRNSIKMLEALDTITAEERLSAGSDKPKRNLLVGLNHSEPLAKLLELDADIRKYRAIASSS